MNPTYFIQYTSPNDGVMAFWCKGIQTTGSQLICTGVKVMAAHHGTNTAIVAYAKELQSIIIPKSLEYTIKQVDEPVWWNRTAIVAACQAEEIARSRTARDLAKDIANHYDSLVNYFSDLEEYPERTNTLKALL